MPLKPRDLIIDNWDREGIVIERERKPAASWLFAIRGAGPPVIVSQRIIGDALDSNGRYRLYEVTPTESGVRVEFQYWPDHEHEARTNRDASWPDIQRWVKEAEVSTPVTTTPLGTYRLLPVNSAGRVKLVHYVITSARSNCEPLRKKGGGEKVVIFARVSPTPFFCGLRKFLRLCEKETFASNL
jgi:hypothetical protein